MQKHSVSAKAPSSVRPSPNNQDDSLKLTLYVELREGFHSCRYRPDVCRIPTSCSILPVEQVVQRRLSSIATDAPGIQESSDVSSCADITIAQKTYVYDMDSEEWISHMSSLGFDRLQDEQRELTRPLMTEDMAREIKSLEPIADQASTDTGAVPS